jgi:hypothetical protein
VWANKRVFMSKIIPLSLICVGVLMTMPVVVNALDLPTVSPNFGGQTNVRISQDPDFSRYLFDREEENDELKRIDGARHNYWDFLLPTDLPL